MQTNREFLDNTALDIEFAVLHLPIVRLTEDRKIQNVGVKEIFLLSFKNLNELRAELKPWEVDIDVLDIYDCIEKKESYARKIFIG